MSANRANAARRALVFGGLPDTQIARVVGYASSALFDREDPFNPVNRRIDIIVLTKKAQRRLEGQDGQNTDTAEPPAPATDAPPGAATPGSTPSPAEPLGAGEVREKLNVFEDGALQFDQPSE